jgi:hypothetical protein
MIPILSALAAAAAFVLANWQWFLTGFVVLVSLGNKLLPGHPRLASFARGLADLFALMPMPAAKSRALLWLAGKIGPNAAGAAIDWLARYLNLPFSSSVSSVPPPDNVVSLPPRGAVPLAFLFAAAGALTVGVLGWHGLWRAAIAAFGIFAGLLAAYVAHRGQAVFIAAICAVNLSSCALATKEGRAQVGRDLLACGIEVGLAEFDVLNQATHHILEDGRIGEGEVTTALDQLAAAAKPGLLHCLVTLIHDSTAAPAPAASDGAGFAQASLKVSFESKEGRRYRRAHAWLAHRAAK